MTDLERHAILGDQQAQEECTRRGIVLPCPFCGGTEIEYGVCGRDIKSPCYIKCESCSCEIVINERKMVIAIWNTRPAPPIGRCEECRHWEEGECNHPANGWDVPRRGEDEFCNRFEPKGGESDG